LQVNLNQSEATFQEFQTLEGFKRLSNLPARRRGKIKISKSGKIDKNQYFNIKRSSNYKKSPYFFKKPPLTRFKLLFLELHRKIAYFYRKKKPFSFNIGIVGCEFLNTFMC